MKVRYSSIAATGSVFNVDLLLGRLHALVFFERVTCASPAGDLRGFVTYFFCVTVTGTVPAFRACE